MSSKDVVVVLEFTDKGTAKIKKVLQDTEGRLKAVGSSAEKSGKGFKSMTNETNKATEKTSKFKSMLKSTAVQMATGMGIMMGVSGAIRGISNAVKSTIQAGMEFEKEWANVTTMLSISEAETEKMKMGLIKMSPVLGDTTDLAKGMYQVLSASIEPAKALDFLAESAKSAKAGVTDTKTAVDALTTVINAYGMEAEDVTKVSDIMFATVKRGKLTYEGMAGALGTVAPIASQVGVKFEEIAGAMATLTRQGIDVNTTTVQLRQVLVSVLKPTKEAQDEAKRLGLEFNAQALKAKGLSGFLADVQAKTKGNADSTTKLFGNVRALTGIMGLAGERAKEYAYDLELMASASGATEEAFQKQMKSSAFWIDVMKNTIKKLQISFMQGMVEPFKKGVRTSDDLDNSIGMLIDKVLNLGRNVGKTAKKIVDNINIVISTLGGMDNAINTVSKSWAEKMGKKLFGDKSAKEAMSEARQEARKWSEQLEYVTIAYEELAKNYANPKWRREMEARNELMKEGARQTELAKFENKGLLGTMAHLSTEYRNTISNIYATSKSHEEARNRIEAYNNRIKQSTEAHEDNNEKIKTSVEVIKTLTDKAVELKNNIPGWHSALLNELNMVTTSVQNMSERNIKNVGDTLKQWVTVDAGNILSNLPATYEDRALIPMEDKTKKVTEEMAKSFEEIGMALQPIAEEIGGTWGDLIANVGVAFGSLKKDTVMTFKGIADAIGPVLSGKIGGAIGSLISGTKKNFASLGSSLGKSIGGLLGPVGSVVGSLAGGLLGGLFKKKVKKTAEELRAEKLDVWIGNITGAMKNLGDISEETAKIIAEDVVDRGMKGYIAESKNFAKIIEDVGVRQDNINQLWSRATDIIHHVTSGELDAVEGSKALGESFNLLLKGTQDLGLEGSRAMTNFIQKIRESGLEVKEVTEYVNQQLDVVVSGFQSMVGASDGSAESLQRLGTIAMGTFAEMINNGDSYYEALMRMREPVLALAEKYDELGIKGSEAFEELKRLTQITEDHKELVQAIDGANTALTAMNNIGMLTQELFDAMNQEAVTYFNQLVNSGVASEDALKLMTPMLQNIVNLQAQHGFTVDKGTEALIQQAKDMGLVTEAQEDELSRQEKMFEKFFGENGTMAGIFDSFGKKLESIFGNTFGNIVDNAEGVLKASTRHMNSWWEKNPFSPRFEEGGDGGGGGGTPAQHGFHGTVTGPRQFNIEPGRTERVDINPIRPGRPQEEGGASPVVVVQEKKIEPVFIPVEELGGFMIKFLETASDDERFKTKSKSLR